MPAPKSGNYRWAAVACADGDGTTLLISGLRGNPSASSIGSEQYSPSRRKPPVHENTRSQRRARDLNPCALARSPFSRRAPSANSVSPPCLRPRTRSVHGALLRFRPEALPRTSRPVGTSCCAVPARGIEHSHEGATSVAQPAPGLQEIPGASHLGKRPGTCRRASRSSAEREGFEPSIPVKVYSISNAAH